MRRRTVQPAIVEIVPVPRTPAFERLIARLIALTPPVDGDTGDSSTLAHHTAKED